MRFQREGWFQCWPIGTKCWSTIADNCPASQVQRYKGMFSVQFISLHVSHSTEWTLKCKFKCTHCTLYLILHHWECHWCHWCQCTSLYIGERMIVLWWECYCTTLYIGESGAAVGWRCHILRFTPLHTVEASSLNWIFRIFNGTAFQTSTFVELWPFISKVKQKIYIVNQELKHANNCLRESPK